MADEEYFYSTLSAEEIEDRLCHMVPYNKIISLSTAEKALFRSNIGAGESNSGFIILGYFPSVQDMQDSLLTLPSPGDAYGIGERAPYDIYVYDGYHNLWVNNGPLNPGDSVFLDSDVSASKGWTSSKINTELGTKQNKITTSGILKGNGSGTISAAVAGTDFLTYATNYSQIRNITAATYNISAADVGATIAPVYSMRNTSMVVNLKQTVSKNLPNGCEIAILNDFNSTITIKTSGIKVAVPGNTFNNDDGYTTTGAHSFRPADPFCMLGLKKMNGDTNGDSWLITGNVEVVS